MSEAKKQEPKPVEIEPAKPIDRDYQDPILTQPFEITPEQIAKLEKNVTKCFLCKWIVEDYKAHGALTGKKTDDGQFEMFPVRGEIDHLSLELKGKPYPWKQPIKAVESKPHGITHDGKLVPIEPVVAPTPRPDQTKKEESHSPAITIKPDPDAVPLSKPKQQPNSIRF